ncbi:MAG: hypothetical protein IT440_04345 [Phycisphaeraceae bacterium]|nr:hypothetical protein [Phycisphaeraceae bacterium]
MALLLAGCETAPTSTVDRNRLHDEVQATIERFKAQDPGMTERFSTAWGYAVFPGVGKGGIGIGGAYGRGEVYEKGTMVGYCDLSQGTLGFQLGGQVYSQVIFFQDALAMQTFKDGKLAFSAQASAVAAKAGASATADYENGVLVFTIAQGGLMYEATIGGQSFSYEPR